MNAEVVTMPWWLIALYLLGAVGATIVMTQGRVARAVRRLWPELLGCPMCAGFWIGCGSMFAMCIRPGMHPVLRCAMDTAACGFSLSLVSFAIYLLLNRIGHDNMDHGCVDDCPQHLASKHAPKL